MSRLCSGLSQVAGDASEALLVGVLRRSVVPLRLDEAVPDPTEGLIEGGGILVPAVLQGMEARRRGTLPGAHERLQALEQGAQLGLDGVVYLEHMAGRHLHGGDVSLEASGAGGIGHTGSPLRCGRVTGK